MSSSSPTGRPGHKRTRSARDLDQPAAAQRMTLDQVGASPGSAAGSRRSKRRPAAASSTYEDEPPAMVASGARTLDESGKILMTTPCAGRQGGPGVGSSCSESTGCTPSRRRPRGQRPDRRRRCPRSLPPHGTAQLRLWPGHPHLPETGRRLERHRNHPSAPVLDAMTTDPRSPGFATGPTPWGPAARARPATRAIADFRPRRTKDDHADHRDRHLDRWHHHHC